VVRPFEADSKQQRLKLLYGSFPPDRKRRPKLNIKAEGKNKNQLGWF
jgi:hypothetical protein